ncbi:MAG: hypothetical protein U9N81_14620 [Bacillota bacterium]|nr:hypothetical protein [Bacillota bacterium]
MAKLTIENTARVVEAYIGEYASGKSEMAINRALELNKQGRRVTLVDLDTVEPFYTLRPIKKILEEQGLNVISFSHEDAFGLGETGAMLNPRARWALRHEGDVILDIGYGVYGAATLNLVEGIDECPELKVLAVINQSRPMTNSHERTKEYILSLGRVDGLVANTHLGNETVTEVVLQGLNITKEVGEELNLPIVYMAVDEDLWEEMNQISVSVPVKYIKKYMPGAMW